MLQPYSTDLALEPISFSDISQMLPLKVLRQVSWTSKLISLFFERQALFPQVEETGSSLLLGKY